MKSVYLEVVHQAVLAAALLADGEVVAQRAGGVGAVHRVAHRVVVVTGGISHNAGACRRRRPTHTLTSNCENTGGWSRLTWSLLHVLISGIVCNHWQECAPYHVSCTR